MEREALLSVLLILLTGVVLQMFAAWPLFKISDADGEPLERERWLRLWRPLIPTLVVAAGLFGWAFSEPDPVPDPIGLFVFIACAPFAYLLVRACIRAGWSYHRGAGEHGVATVGLLRPRIVFSTDLAKRMDERAVRAALEHERAHVRHRDPLRIWIGQFITDLQWPWGAAQRRFQSWLIALECARDEEARKEGVEGPDLAAAVIVALRFSQSSDPARCCAPLIGDRSALEERIARLLQPLPAAQARIPSRYPGMWLTLCAMLLAIVLGALFGERLIEPLLGFGQWPLVIQ